VGVGLAVAARVGLAVAATVGEALGEADGAWVMYTVRGVAPDAVQPATAAPSAIEISRAAGPRRRGRSRRRAAWEPRKPVMPFLLLGVLNLWLARAQTSW
jgi:hypothetical protein